MPQQNKSSHFNTTGYYPCLGTLLCRYHSNVVYSTVISLYMNVKNIWAISLAAVKPQVKICPSLRSRIEDTSDSSSLLWYVWCGTAGNNINRRLDNFYKHFYAFIGPLDIIYNWKLFNALLRTSHPNILTSSIQHKMETACGLPTGGFGLMLFALAI